MDVNSDGSDVSLDYDEPRRKGKGKAPKKKDKGKSKVTEVSLSPGRWNPPTDPRGECSLERARPPTHGKRLTSGLGTQSRKMSPEAFKLQSTIS